MDTVVVPGGHATLDDISSFETRIPFLCLQILEASTIMGGMDKSQSRKEDMRMRARARVLTNLFKPTIQMHIVWHTPVTVPCEP